MKKITTILTAALLLAATSGLAKNICTVVFSVPQMVCENCEAKVKKNIKNLKGLKSLKTDVPNHTVTVTYDADKTTVKKIQDAFRKFHYEATVDSAVCPTPSAACCQSQTQPASSDCCQ